MKRAKQRHGVAMILAVVLIGLVGMSLAADGVTSYMQFQRTRRAIDDTQLRQLLMAGAHSALVRLQASLPMDGPVTLPHALDGAVIRVISVEGSDSAATVDIHAALDNDQMTERAHFTKATGSWQLDAADLQI